MAGPARLRRAAADPQPVVRLFAELQLDPVLHHRRRQPVDRRLPGLHGRRPERRQAARQGLADAAAGDARRDVRRLEERPPSTPRCIGRWSSCRDWPTSSRSWKTRIRRWPPRRSRYLDHLLDWDCRSSIDSTQTTLCALWYEELYGRGYPVETLKAGVRQRAGQEVRGPGHGRRQAQGVLRRLEGALGRRQPHAAARQLCRRGQDSLLRLRIQPALRRRPRPPGRGVQHLLRAADRRAQEAIRRRGRVVHRRV